MLIVAIAGGSGSGKTSVANQLCTALSAIEFSCTNLCEDSYYYSLNEAQLENVSAYNFDHPDAINHAQLMAHLDLLKQGLAIEAPTYCYKTHQQLDSTITMTPADVFVLEGLHLLHREHLLPFYDPIHRQMFTRSILHYDQINARIQVCSVNYIFVLSLKGGKFITIYERSLK